MSELFGMTQYECLMQELREIKELLGERNGTRFKRPTVDEVAAYCKERGNDVDPEAFVAHYEANGWRRGKTPVKDWHACVRTWERSNGKADDWEHVHGIVRRVWQPDLRNVDELRDCLDAAQMTAVETVGITTIYNANVLAQGVRMAYRKAKP